MSFIHILNLACVTMYVVGWAMSWSVLRSAYADHPPGVINPGTRESVTSIDAETKLAPTPAVIKEKFDK